MDPVVYYDSGHLVGLFCFSLLHFFFLEKVEKMSHPRKVLVDNAVIRSTVPPREVMHITKSQCHPHQIEATNVVACAHVLPPHKLQDAVPGGFI